MTQTQIQVDAIRIAGLNGLDPIEVFWNEIGDGKGLEVINMLRLCVDCIFRRNG